jgi:hypothetical protein
VNKDEFAKMLITKMSDLLMRLEKVLGCEGEMANENPEAMYEAAQDLVGKLDFMQGVAGRLSEALAQIAELLDMRGSPIEPEEVVAAVRRRVDELTAAAKKDRQTIVAIHKITRGVINGTGPRIVRDDA